MLRTQNASYVTVESFIWTHAADERLPIIEFIIAADLTNAAGRKMRTLAEKQRAACEISVKYLSLGRACERKLFLQTVVRLADAHARARISLRETRTWDTCRFPPLMKIESVGGRLRQDVSHGITKSTRQRVRNS